MSVEKPTYEELEALVRRYKDALMRINIHYRSGSGLPLHLQAYCMRSEAKAALDPSMEANWCAELAEIQDTCAGQLSTISDAEGTPSQDVE